MSDVKSYATSHNISEQQAYNELVSNSTNMQYGGQLSGGLGVKEGGFNGGGSISASMNEVKTNSTSSTHNQSNTSSNSNSSSHSENQQFSWASQDLQAALQSHQLGSLDSETRNHLESYGNNLRNAQDYASSYSADLSKEQSLSEQQSYVDSHNAAINQNASQLFADYVKAHDPVNYQNVLQGNTPHRLEQQKAMAESFLSEMQGDLASQLESGKYNVDLKDSYTQAKNDITSAHYKDITDTYNFSKREMQGSEGLQNATAKS